MNNGNDRPLFEDDSQLLLSVQTSKSQAGHGRCSFTYAPSFFRLINVDVTSAIVTAVSHMINRALNTSVFCIVTSIHTVADSFDTGDCLLLMGYYYCEPAY